MEKRAIAVAFFSLLVTLDAFACSQPPPPDVRTAYRESEAVYLAVAKSIKVNPQHNDKFSWVEQEVTFEVVQSWKGNFKVGEKLLFNTVVSSGCGVSVDNYDHWLEEEPSKEDSEPVYPKLSGVWLIYAYDAKHLKLEAVGRTKPLEGGGALDLEELYRLSKKNR